MAQYEETGKHTPYILCACKMYVSFEKETGHTCLFITDRQSECRPSVSDIGVLILLTVL